MLVTRNFAAGLLSLAILLAAGSAPAQQAPSEPNGQLNAASYTFIPQQARVQVRDPDNNDANESLTLAFENELTNRGFEVVEDGGEFILSFSMSGSFRPGRTERRLQLVDIDGGNGRPDMEGRDSGEIGASNTASAKLNIFNTAGGSVFNRGQRFRKFGTGRHSLQIWVQEAESGKRAWQASVYADVRGGDPLVVAEELVPVAMDRFGDTVRRERFTFN